MPSIRTLYELEHSEFTRYQTNTVHLKWYLLDRYTFDFNKQNMVVAGSRERKEYFKRIIETCVEDYEGDFSADCKFELKIERPGTDGLKTARNLHGFYEADSKAPGPNIHSVTEFEVVEENVWHRLPVEYVQNEIENHFDFKFIIDYGCYALKRINVPKSKLKKNLMNLLDNSIYSDVKIKSCGNGTEFNVHKLILVARCDYFKDCFEKNMADDSTDIVESPFTADVLQQILIYIYTDNAPEIEDKPKEMLKAASFYKISRLKKLCETALHKSLTVENAIDILELAHEHNAIELKQISLEFLDVEKVKNVIETPSWQKLESVELIKSILERIVSNINP